MKKLLLIFTMLYASTLIGMEPDAPMSSERSPDEKIPEEINNYLVSTLMMYNNLDSTIKAIKKDGHFKDILNLKDKRLKKFTYLVHLIAEVFNYANNNNITTEAIAEKFNTPAASTYLEIGEALLTAAKYGYTDLVTKLIKADADVNFTAGKFFDKGESHVRPFLIRYAETSPLTYAVIYGNAGIVQLLLKSGAIPNPADYYELGGYYPPKFSTSSGIVTGSAQDRVKIQEMITDAYNKLAEENRGVYH